MFQISPDESNIEEFYSYLHEEYQMAVAKIEEMRFDLQWIAIPERLQIINLSRSQFQEYLHELVSLGKFIDDMIHNTSNTSTKHICFKCKELCHALQKLAKSVIMGVEHAESNLIVCDNQLAATPH